MAGTSPLAGLLDRAGNVFALAWQLGQLFREERGTRGGVRTIDPGGWDRHQPAFNQFCAAVLSLRDAMQAPPDGFAPVAKVLLNAAAVAKQIRDAMQTAEGRGWAAYLDFFPELNSVAIAGQAAIREVTEARRPDDPFAFLDQSATVKESGIDTTLAQPSTGRGPDGPNPRTVTDPNRDRAGAEQGEPADDRSASSLPLMPPPPGWSSGREYDAPVGGEMLRLAPDVLDLGPRPGTRQELWEWCRRQSERLRRFRIRLSEPPSASVASVEFRMIPEIVHWCRDYLSSFGVDDIPERFTFSLPRNQTPTGPEHFYSEMEEFISWASAYHAPKHGIMKLIDRIEEFLMWAMGRTVQPEPAGGSSRGDQKPEAPAEPPRAQTAGDSTPRASRDELIRQLEPAVRLAFLAFCYAETKEGKRLEDREAYTLLKEDGIPEGAGGLGELAEYPLPAFDSWARYLRAARKVLGESKYTRRTGRRTGKSIVRGDQVEKQQFDEGDDED
jgi:hypothetical protein